MKNPLFELVEGEVHLWFAYPDEWEEPALIAAAHTILDDGEIARSERLRFPAHRRLFLASRLLLRTTLSRYGSVPPEAWRFVTNDHGKPRVAPAAETSAPAFNLAHTAGLAVVGVTGGREIGVDAERRDRRVSARDLIRRFFSPEEAAELGKLPGGCLADRFFLYWTLKEAYLKAIGRGLSLPLGSFGFQLAGTRPYRIAFTGFPGAKGEEAGTRHFALVEPRPPYIAAMSVAAGPAQRVTLRCYRMEPPGEAAWLACTPLPCPAIALSAGVTCIKI